MLIALIPAVTAAPAAATVTEAAPATAGTLAGKQEHENKEQSVKERRILSGVAVAVGLGAALAGCGSAHVVSPSHSASASASRTAAVSPSARIPGFTGSATATRAPRSSAACSPRTSKGACYAVGQQCPVKYYNALGVSGSGTRMACAPAGTGGTWRWTAEPLAG